MGAEDPVGGTRQESPRASWRPAAMGAGHWRLPPALPASAAQVAALGPESCGATSTGLAIADSAPACAWSCQRELVPERARLALFPPGVIRPGGPEVRAARVGFLVVSEILGWVWVVGSDSLEGEELRAHPVGGRSTFRGPCGVAWTLERQVASQKRLWKPRVGIGHFSGL